MRILFWDRPELLDRLDPLQTDAEERARVAILGEGDARRVLAGADEKAEAQWTQVAKLDEELRRLDALMAGAAERLGGARRRRESREVELAALDDELSRAGEALAAAETAAAEERSALPERRELVARSQKDLEEKQREAAEARERSQRLTALLQEAEIEARGAEQKGGAAQLRFEEALTGISEAEAALAGLAQLRAGLQEAHDRAIAVAETAAHGATFAQRWAAEAEQRAQKTRAEADSGERELNDMRARERDLAGALDELTDRKNQAEVRRAESRARSAALAERAMEDWGFSLDALLQMETLDEPAAAEARARVEILERNMRRMGAINPRAAEEYAELAERETFLVEQIDDLKSSRQDLMKVVKEVDDTIVEVFGDAFQKVATEFEGVFQRLFPGGSGAITLTDPDDILSSGIEIEARPPGKNVRKLSLLSGGERSLVALAFLFSIFRSHPSPFYLLDEVEAALDDFNLQRFIGLIRELEERAQILVVTHQKRTMETADVLYGVSMAKDGVSQVVAKKMDRVPVAP